MKARLALILSVVAFGSAPAADETVAVLGSIEWSR